MKSSFFLLSFVVVCIGYTLESDCAGILNKLNPRCMGNCPLRKDYKENIARLFDQELVGQGEAVDRILAAIYNHDGKAPLVFHFSGDNGTGKTLTATLITEGKFSKRDSVSDTPLGALYLRGNSFLYDESGAIRKAHPEEYFKKIESFKEQVHNDVARQLQSCPQSVIIFDEYTIPNRRVLSALEDFLDGSPVRLDDNVYVTSKFATFVFLSDFGVESFSHKHSHDELVQLIEKDVSECWGPNLMKTRQIQNNIIPFRPLPLPNIDSINSISIHDITVPESARELISTLIDKIEVSDGFKYWVEKKKLSFLSTQCAQLCKDKVARIIYHSLVTSELYRYRNFRGLEQLFQQSVTRKIVSEFITAPNGATFRISINPDISNKSITVSLPVIGQ